MPTHQLIITLGSNYEAKTHLQYILDHLPIYLSDLIISPKMLTQPIDFPYPSDLFTNYVIKAYTLMEERALQNVLTKLETDCGRTLESRKMHPERVTADIDLIIWDGEIRKPKDLLRPYFAEGLRAIEEIEKDL